MKAYLGLSWDLWEQVGLSWRRKNTSEDRDWKSLTCWSPRSQLTGVKERVGESWMVGCAAWGGPWPRGRWHLEREPSPEGVPHGGQRRGPSGYVAGPHMNLVIRKGWREPVGQQEAPSTSGVTLQVLGSAVGRRVTDQRAREGRAWLWNEWLRGFEPEWMTGRMTKKTKGVGPEDGPIWVCGGGRTFCVNVHESQL